LRRNHPWGNHGGTERGRTQNNWEGFEKQDSQATLRNRALEKNVGISEVDFKPNFVFTYKLLKGLISSQCGISNISPPIYKLLKGLISSRCGISNKAFTCLCLILSQHIYKLHSKTWDRLCETYSPSTNTCWKSYAY